MKRPFLIAAVALAIAAAGFTIASIAQGSFTAPIRWLFPGVAAPVADPPKTTEQLLAEWERFGLGVGYETISANAKAVRAATARGDAEALGRLIGIASNDGQGSFSRGVALDVACDLADDASAQRIFDWIKGLRDEWIASGQSNTPVDPTARLTPRETRYSLVSHFVHSDLKKLLDVMSGQQRVLEFLKDYYLSGRVNQNCADLLARCEVPVEAKRAVVLEIIADERNRRHPLPGVLVELLDASVFPELRRLMRSNTTRGEFNWGAADALAYLGDTEIVPDLEELRPMFESAGKSAMSFRRLWLWQIEAQNPPSRLLEYIASVDTEIPARKQRPWAVRRAVHLGIESDRIRAAILSPHVA